MEDNNISTFWINIGTTLVGFGIAGIIFLFRKSDIITPADIITPIGFFIAGLITYIVELRSFLRKKNNKPK